MATTNSNHAALLCPPGLGHIIPALELAKRLVTHSFVPKLTFFLASVKNSGGGSQAETEVLRSAKESKLFDIIQLPPIDIITKIGPHASLGIKIVATMKQAVPLLSQAISTMMPPQKPNILILDLFGCTELPLARKLKMPIFTFIPTSASILALSLHTPTLDKCVQGEYVDQTKPILIPGCNPIHPSDLFDPLLDRNDKLYHEFLHVCEELRTVDGILVNTFHELEPTTLAALRSGQISKVPVYPIGPWVRETKQNCGEKGSYVLEWLDKQEEESVVYVSLGSGYTMSYEQIKEMALGLELSGKKFVWSVRPPATKAGEDHYLTAGEDGKTSDDVSKPQRPSNFPDEFYKIQEMGLMVMDWAPQLEILRHSSVGGFVTHCGWNSALESVSSGIPMVGWPLFAEQRMNAAILAEEAGVAVRVRVSMSNNMVERGEIAKAIRKIMDEGDIEGCAMRKRVKELKHIVQSDHAHAISEMATAFAKISHSNNACV